MNIQLLIDQPGGGVRISDVSFDTQEELDHYKQELRVIIKALDAVTNMGELHTWVIQVIEFIDNWTLDKTPLDTR